MDIILWHMSLSDEELQAWVDIENSRETIDDDK